MRNRQQSFTSRPSVKGTKNGTSYGNPAEAQSPLPTDRLEHLLDDWLCYCRIRQHSEKTIQARYDMVMRLVTWLRAEGKGECGHSELMRYFGSLKNLRTGKAMRASSVATLHRCYKTFWRWMLAEGIIEESAMERIPVPRENRDALHIFEQEQFKAMMRAIEKHPQRKRNKAHTALT